MTEQIALQQKLHNPERRTDESYEDYVKRRKDSRELNKLIKRGRLFWESRRVTFHEVDGKTVPKVWTKTYVKKEN
jgi:hypothetical protein